jgi:hypothetical protein
VVPNLPRLFRPPFHGGRVRRGSLEQLEVDLELTYFATITKEGDGTQAQHGVGSRKGAVGLDVDGDV